MNKQIQSLLSASKTDENNTNSITTYTDMVGIQTYNNIIEFSTNKLMYSIVLNSPIGEATVERNNLYTQPSIPMKIAATGRYTPISPLFKMGEIIIEGKNQFGNKVKEKLGIPIKTKVYTEYAYSSIDRITFYRPRLCSSARYTIFTSNNTIGLFFDTNMLKIIKMVFSSIFSGEKKEFIPNEDMFELDTKNHILTIKDESLVNTYNSIIIMTAKNEDFFTGIYKYIYKIPKEPPENIRNLKASGEFSRIELSWDKYTREEARWTQIDVYRGLSETNLSLYASIETSDNTFVDILYDTDLTYYYRIIPSNIKGEGNPSSIVHAQPKTNKTEIITGYNE